MAFTIEVEKREKGEEFGLEDLEMFHGECYGGEIKQDFKGDYWGLTCQRCGQQVAIHLFRKEPTEIVKTAIDGRERRIEAMREERDSVIVIQKN